MLRKVTLFAVMAAMGICAPAVSQASGSMKTGGLTSQPIGHYEFCRIYRDQCDRDTGDTGPLRLDSKIWSAILNVNSTVNMVIEPKSDIDIYGKEEVWTFPDKAGDCEDYVLLKRQLLINEGISPSDLLITVVRKPNGEGHAVLTLRTNDGDFILDNLNDDVLAWSDTPYTFLKRQASFDSGRWVKVETGTDLPVASLR